MRLMVMVMMAAALVACAPGDGDDDRPPAPMCPEIDWETACPARGFPHVARRWRTPNEQVTTIDTKAPPEASWVVGVSVTTWCVMNPERPDLSDRTRSFAETPSPLASILGENEWRAMWAGAEMIGRFITVAVDNELFMCADRTLPAGEYSVKVGTDLQRHFYPENVPRYSYCDGSCDDAPSAQ